MTTRNSAELATANNVGEQIETRTQPVAVRIQSSIVTGNGWLPDLKEGEKRRRFEADLDWEKSRSLGIKGSPLGRGWTEEEAKADLVARVMHESGIRLELKDNTEAKALAHLELIEKREMLKGDGITQLISDKLGIDIEMPPHLSDDFEDVIFHSINKKIDELMKEVDA